MTLAYRLPLIGCLLALLLFGGSQRIFATEKLGAFVRGHCLDCHNKADAIAQLDLESLSLSLDGSVNPIWEKVVHRLRARQMPPVDSTRPSEESYKTALDDLERALDQYATLHPRVVNPPSVRRLNRTEYQNAIRDLLALDIDAESLLPPDESSHGFDNITVSDLSPTLLARYVTAAQRISRLAVGVPPASPSGDTFRVPADLTQDTHVEGLPLGTRGGVLIPYWFPTSGEYEIQIRLTRDRDEKVEGLNRRHRLDVLVDDELKERFTIQPPKNRDYASVDRDLRATVTVQAGLHRVGVTFVAEPAVLLETKRQPYDAHFNLHRHPRLGPAIFQVSIVGPMNTEKVSDPDGAKHPEGRSGHRGQTPFPNTSRRRLFGEDIDRLQAWANADDAREVATRAIASLARRAYRRPLRDDDLQVPMEFYDEARASGGSFDVGIEAAVSSVLVNPHFLLRVERNLESAESGDVFRVSDLELASRLSFFLWSSIPDDELLAVAERGELQDPEVLDGQVMRMLDDPKSQNLITNFVDQWLYLRNLSSITPDLRLFPDFDENLREAFRRETSLFVESVFRENRSVLDLIRADYTFANERLAKHYNIPHVYGSHFRRVSLEPESKRGGLLRHGSILTATSYATRTSPVIRGHWILKNLMGLAPPPPPANVPTLPDVTVAGNLTVRERLAEHRANAACAVCHDTMDPVGFALENFDAVGRWRDHEEGIAIDATGGLPDGSECDGIDGLEEGLLHRMPEIFVSTLVERLLTFALGRGMELDDRPAIREIVRTARNEDYRFSTLVLAITRSAPFQMRMSP
jgi:hypothetical protein